MYIACLVYLVAMLITCSVSNYSAVQKLYKHAV